MPAKGTEPPGITVNAHCIDVDAPWRRRHKNSILQTGVTLKVLKLCIVHVRNVGVPAFAEELKRFPAPSYA